MLCVCVASLLAVVCLVSLALSSHCCVLASGHLAGEPMKRTCLEADERQLSNGSSVRSVLSSCAV